MSHFERLTEGTTPRTLTACLECDTLYQRLPAERGVVSVCPLCGVRDSASRPLIWSHPLALALAALVVALPANFYPQMSFSLLGRPNEYTLAGGAWHLLDAGFWWVGGLILLCTVVAPLILLTLLLAVLLACRLGTNKGFITLALKWYQQITSWVMLDVYLLAVIVSVVKLRDMGQFELSLGFYCFVLMLILTSAATVSFNAEAVWDWLEERDRARG